MEKGQSEGKTDRGGSKGRYFLNKKQDCKGWRCSLVQGLPTMHKMLTGAEVGGSGHRRYKQGSEIQDHSKLYSEL